MIFLDAAVNRYRVWLKATWSDWNLMHPIPFSNFDPPMLITTKGLAKTTWSVTQQLESAWYRRFSGVRMDQGLECFDFPKNTPAYNLMGD